MHMIAFIKVINEHQQECEYEHRYNREKQPNRLVIGEPRVRYTIIEDVAAETNIDRIILLAATMRKYLKTIRRSKI
jgi:hypothetical protein